jgi:hypothetical protein
VWPRTGTSVTDLGEAPKSVADIAVGPTAVFTVWGWDLNGGVVSKYPLDGSGRQDLVTGLPGPLAIIADPDGSAIYWGDEYSGEIDRLDL